MRKYMIGLSVLFSFVMFFGIKTNHVNAAPPVVGSMCGSSCSAVAYWVQHGIPGKPGSYMQCQTTAGGVIKAGRKCGGSKVLRLPIPVALNIEVPNPIPNTPLYNLAAYPFSNFGFPSLPTNDPIIIGHIDPNNYTQGIPLSQGGVSEYNTVTTPAGPTMNSGVPLPSILWPAKSLFNDLAFWNKPLSFTFQAVRDLTVQAGQGKSGSTYITPAPSKWYPLNYFTFSDPTSIISLLPSVPVNTSWDSVAGATKYKFSLFVNKNPLGAIPPPGYTVDNAPFPSPLDNIQTSLTHTFFGLPSASYYWTATPLKAINGVDTVIVGDPIIKSPISIFFPANINGPSLSQPYSFTYDHYEYGWDKIPGAVKYEIITSPIGTPIILSSVNASDDLGWGTTTYSDLNIFHYDFTNSVIAGASLSWVVRGIDENGNVVRNNLVQSGYVSVPLPMIPYQSAYLNWPKVNSATSYVVDIVENISDFSKLPYLTSSEVPLVKTTSSVARNGSTSISQSTETTTGTDSNIFLLRAVVPNIHQDNSEVVVAKFKRFLKEARVYQGDVYDSLDHWNYDGGAIEQLTFDDQAAADPSNLNFHPLISDDLGMTISSPVSGQLKLITMTPITITNKSTGNAKLTVTQSNSNKTTILTFSIQSGVPGEYAFDITKNVTFNFSCFAGSTCVVHPLTYDTIGPMPVIVDLTNKSYSEFDKLLPNKKYYWRVRSLKDPQISNPSSTAAITFPDSWSSINSFTTPVGLPLSLDDKDTLVNLINTTASIIKPSGSKKLNWNVNPYATSYNIEIYSSSNLTKLPIRTETNITTASYELKNLNLGVRYYFVIRGVNQYGIGPKTPIYSFIATEPVSVSSTTLIKK